MPLSTAGRLTCASDFVDPFVGRLVELPVRLSVIHCNTFPNLTRFHCTVACSMSRCRVGVRQRSFAWLSLRVRATHRCGTVLRLTVCWASAFRVSRALRCAASSRRLAKRGSCAKLAQLHGHEPPADSQAAIRLAMDGEGRPAASASQRAEAAAMQTR